ncbi:MAG: hypothetical protein DRP87_16440 [Spirochaetes bacterium]|nr:MAG: hypothetical protein DRP87_16440 [Spirochaetota bacterium]
MSTRHMDLLIKSGLVVTCDGKRKEYRQRNLTVQDGIIREITEREIPDNRRFRRIIDASGKIIIPGLINAHTHSYVNLTRGLIDTIPMEIWMLYITASGRLLEPEENCISALLGIAEMLRSGTATCIDHLAQSYDGLEASNESVRVERNAGGYGLDDKRQALLSYTSHRFQRCSSKNI